MTLRYFGRILGVLAIGIGLLSGCGRRAVRIELVPVAERLVPQLIEADVVGTSNKIAMVDVSGMLLNSRSKAFLSSGSNPVSDLRETLRAIEKDDDVKAVILRINSPGGTVTASDMMYRELQSFKARSHRPVVTCMLDLCASGGYYVSCASDYRIAYPTTLTGSIGVIVQTFSIAGTLDKLGISTYAVTSGPNKDMGSPLRPFTKNDEQMIRQFVGEFYQGFLKVVKDSPQHVKAEDWATATDGRVVTGREAWRLGLVDEVGDLDRAIQKAKELAGVKYAKIIAYTHLEEAKGSVYAAKEVPAPQMNLVNFNLAAPELLEMAGGRPGFYYLWTGR